MTELVATSDGELVANPRWTKRTASRLADVQRQIARRQPGSKRRRRAVEEAGRLRRKARNQRRDHHHLLSRRLVDRYDVIVHEDLKITNLMRRPAPRPDGEGGFAPNGAAAKTGLNRSIADAGWANLLALLRYKAMLLCFQGAMWRGWLGCGQTRDGPLRAERRLLLGHAPAVGVAR